MANFLSGKQVSNPTRPWRSPSAILILHAGALGDILLSLPLLQIARQRFPAARIILGGQTEPLQLAAENGLADGVISLEGMDFHLLFEQAGYRPSVILQRFLSQFSHLLALWQDGDGLLTRNLAQTPLQDTLVYSPRPSAGVHASEHLLRALPQIGLPAEVPFVRLSPSPAMRQEALEFLQPLPKPWIFLHPGSGGRHKIWPASRLAAVAAEIQHRWGGSLLLLAGPAEEEVLAEFRQHFAFTLVRKPLRQVAALLSCGDLYLGNDSGISHLAAVCGIQTLVLFGPTDPAQWKPPGAVVVTAQADCPRCRERQRFDCRERVCFETISPQRVVETVAQMAWPR